VTSFLYDVRHAGRSLRHHPGFLAVVVLTLGFGIGINTATFSLVNAALIRPMPFDQPERREQLRTDCSLTADSPTAAMPNVEHLHDVAFDREQDSINVRARAIEKVPHVNG
jgi:hypothetical protein